MEKEFIPYEQALDLEELGFNEPCISFYSSEKELYPVMQQPAKGPYFNNGSFIETIRAALYQQVFRWFREKYGLVGLIEIGTQEFTFNIFDDKGEAQLSTVSMYNYNGTYEEAELECLKKLISIIKNK